MLDDDELLPHLVDALERTRAGAPTKPVSVTLPAPLAEAFRMLVDHNLIDSVSVAATRALEEALQAIVVGLRLDAMYDQDPTTRPEENVVTQMAARAGIDL